MSTSKRSSLGQGVRGNYSLQPDLNLHYKNTPADALEDILDANMYPLAFPYVADTEASYPHSRMSERRVTSSTLFARGNSTPDRKGSPNYKAVVCHAPHPFISPDRIRKARKEGLKIGGGTLTREEFEELLEREGEIYAGEKAVYVLTEGQIKQHQSGEALSREEAREDPLMKALFGGVERLDRLLDSREESGKRKLSVRFNDSEPEYPIGRLASLATNHIDLTTRFDNPTRFVADPNRRLWVPNELTYRNLMLDLEGYIPEAIHDEVREIVRKHLPDSQ